MPRVSVFTPTVDSAVKTPYLNDLYGSILRQTMPDWELTLMTDRPEDYEALQAAGWDDRVRVVFDDSMNHATQHPIPFLFNRFFPEARGEFIIVAFDDDFFHEDTFGVCVEFMDANPDQLACYFSLQHQSVSGPGIVEGGRSTWFKADHVRVSGGVDCQMDGGQACVRKTLLGRVPSPWWPETPDRGSLTHCDGLYLEKLTEFTSFTPAGDPDVPYLTHRFTPVSTFTKNH
jgi:hypothetical protein